MLNWLFRNNPNRIDKFIINREISIKRFKELSSFISAKANQIDSLIYSEKQICQAIMQNIAEYNILNQELEESKLNSGRIQDSKKIIIKNICALFSNLKIVSIHKENEIINVEEFQTNNTKHNANSYNFHDFENSVINYNAPYTHTMMDNLIKSINLYIIFKRNQIKSNEQSLKDYKNKVLR